MYDKTIRRRRLGLGVVIVGLLLVAAVVSPDVRRGVAEVASPVGDGAGQTAKPVANLFGWISDTVTAKGDLADVREERDQSRDSAIRAEVAAGENPQLRGLSELDQAPVSLRPYRPVTARVVGRSPASWYQRIIIGKGSSSGIRADMPVVAADGAGRDDRGLIGSIESATADSAVVRLLTDPSMAVAVMTSAGAAAGTVSTSSSSPRDLELASVPKSTAVAPGDVIVTQGTTSERRDLPSLYPPGLQIGRVSRVTDEGTLEQTPHLQAFVDTRRVLYVQVLSRRVNNNR